MKNRIWKFQLSVVDEQFVQMPAGASILTVQVQGGAPCIWALVDPEARMEQRRIFTHGTGHVISSEAFHYVGTYQLSGGALVFHVFEPAV